MFCEIVDKVSGGLHHKCQTSDWMMQEPARQPQTCRGLAENVANLSKTRQSASSNGHQNHPIKAELLCKGPSLQVVRLSQRQGGTPENTSRIERNPGVCLFGGSILDFGVVDAGVHPFSRSHRRCLRATLSGSYPSSE